MSLHHALDVEPVSEKALYVHESDLADPSQADVPVASKAQEIRWIEGSACSWS